MRLKWFFLKKSIGWRKERGDGGDGIEEYIIYIYEYLAEYFQNILSVFQITKANTWDERVYFL